MSHHQIATLNTPEVAAQRLSEAASQAYQAATLLFLADDARHREIKDISERLSALSEDIGKEVKTDANERSGREVDPK